MAKRNPTEAEIEATEVQDVEVEDTPFAGELLIDLPSDFAEQMAIANKPPIEPGTYLATILNVLPKVTDKGTHASKGLMWTMIINKDPEAVTNGWNPDAGSVNYQHYTYIGKVVNGKLTDTDKGGMTRDMAAALGITGSFGLSAVKNRQVLVVVKHEPSMDDASALAQDPTHEVEKYYIKATKVKAYIVDGVRGPRNEFLSDGSEDAAPANPAW